MNEDYSIQPRSTKIQVIGLHIEQLKRKRKKIKQHIKQPGFSVICLLCVRELECKYLR